MLHKMVSYYINVNFKVNNTQFARSSFMWVQFNKQFNKEDFIC